MNRKSLLLAAGIGAPTLGMAADANGQTVLSSRNPFGSESFGVAADRTRFGLVVGGGLSSLLGSYSEDIFSDEVEIGSRFGWNLEALVQFPGSRRPGAFFEIGLAYTQFGETLESSEGEGDVDLRYLMLPIRWGVPVHYEGPGEVSVHWHVGFRIGTKLSDEITISVDGEEESGDFTEFVDTALLSEDGFSDDYESEGYDDFPLQWGLETGLGVSIPVDRFKVDVRGSVYSDVIPFNFEYPMWNLRYGLNVGIFY